MKVKRVLFGGSTRPTLHCQLCFNFMLIKKKYRIRHKLLGILYDEFFENSSPVNDELDAALTFSKLEEKSNLTVEQLVKTIDYLKEANEILVVEFDLNQYYLITLKGRSTYHDKKYIYNGRKEFQSDTYDLIKIISTIILLIIAIVTFVQNYTDTRQNRKEIQKLKTELNQIKSSRK